MEYADHESQQLGFVDVATTDLLGQYAEENHGKSTICCAFFSNSQMYLIEFARELVRISDGPALELVASCSAIPLEISEDHSVSFFHDSAEEEALRHQCMLNAHWNESISD